MEQIVVLLVDFGQNPISTPLLTVELGTMAICWAIYDTLAHSTFASTWEKLVVSNQI
jgi:hypothetical protein